VDDPEVSDDNDDILPTPPKKGIAHCVIVITQIHVGGGLW